MNETMKYLLSGEEMHMNYEQLHYWIDRVIQGDISDPKLWNFAGFLYVRCTAQRKLAVATMKNKQLRYFSSKHDCCLSIFVWDTNNVYKRQPVTVTTFKLLCCIICMFMLSVVNFGLQSN
jgi:hypothetical protein